MMVALLLVLGLFLAWEGWGYYVLPLDARPTHPRFRQLSPGGMVGHGYGIAGFALILTNLLYLVRRRLARWRLGPLKVWLDLHVTTGLVGSLLVVYHSAFQMRNSIAAMTSASLALVVLTGLVGRYLYSIAPRFDTDKVNVYYVTLDSFATGLSQEVRVALAKHPVKKLAANSGLFNALFSVPAWAGQARARSRIVKSIPMRVAHALDKKEYRQLQQMCRDFAYTANGEIRSEAGTAILRGWRGLHRFFAILMVLSVSVHIGVAWYYGYRWIWSQ